MILLQSAALIFDKSKLIRVDKYFDIISNTADFFYLKLNPLTYETVWIDNFRIHPKKLGADGF